MRPGPSPVPGNCRGGPTLRLWANPRHTARRGYVRATTCAPPVAIPVRLRQLNRTLLKCPQRHEGCWRHGLRATPKHGDVEVRMMLKVKMDTEAGSAAIQDGSLQMMLQQMMSELQPEAAYFGPDGGRRPADGLHRLRHERSVAAAGSHRAAVPDGEGKAGDVSRDGPVQTSRRVSRRSRSSSKPLAPHGYRYGRRRLPRGQCASGCRSRSGSGSEQFLLLPRCNQSLQLFQNLGAKRGSGERRDQDRAGVSGIESDRAQRAEPTFCSAGANDLVAPNLNALLRASAAAVEDYPLRCDLQRSGNRRLLVPFAGPDDCIAGHWQRQCRWSRLL